MWGPDIEKKSFSEQKLMHRDEKLKGMNKWKQIQIKLDRQTKKEMHRHIIEYKY